VCISTARVVTFDIKHIKQSMTFDTIYVKFESEVHIGQSSRPQQKNDSRWKTGTNWKLYITRIPSGIWSSLYGWLLWMCVPRIGSFPSTLNTWSKVWPWILIWAYLIWNFGQQISIVDPLTLDFLVRLGLNFRPMGEFGGGMGCRLGLRHCFVTDRNVTT